MQVYKDGRIDHYKKIFKNVSFTSALPTDDWLNANGAYRIISNIDFNKDTQRLVGSEVYIEDGLAYVVRVENKTEDEIAAEVATKNAALAFTNRNTRNQLLSQTDWTQLSDSPLSTEQKGEWATYRQTLRDLTANESWPNIVFPDAPNNQEE